MKRALLLSAVLGAPAASFVLVVACSDSGTIVAPADAGPDAALFDATPGPDAFEAGADSDAGPMPDASDELAIPDGCGAAPWVKLGIVVGGLSLGASDASPLPGVTFSSPLCPGYVERTNEAGAATGLVSANVPFYGALTDPGYVSELSPEEILDADSTSNKLEMIPTIVEGFVGWDGGGPVVVVAVQAVSKDAGACSTLDGVTLGVQGASGVRVVYLSDGAIPAPVPDAGATTARGFAALFDLPDDAFVTLTGTKPGCQVVFKRGHLTGRVPIASGYASLMAAYLTP